MQIVRRVELQGAPGYAVNDLPCPGGLGAEYEGVAENLRPFTNGGVELVVLCALRPFRDSFKRYCSVPVSVGAVRASQLLFSVRPLRRYFGKGAVSK